MRFNQHVTIVAVAMTLCATTWVAAQRGGGSTFQFYVSAVDGKGAPVTDLRNDDVVMMEDGNSQTVSRVEKVTVPIKLTIAVDNGVESGGMLTAYRAGLKGMIDALPSDVEVTLITTAPQPRMVVKASTDKIQILKGVTSFAPETARPRFSDTIVEYSERLQKEMKDRNSAPYAPVMVMISTGAVEASSYQGQEIDKAITFLAQRHARINVVMISTHLANAKSKDASDSNLQASMAAPLVKLTNGRYESINQANALETMLPEWGKALAGLHQRQSQQFRVTVERSRSGPLQNPRIELARQGLSGSVTIDGVLQ